MNIAQTITLDRHLELDELVAVARHHAKVELSGAFMERVRDARKIVEEKVAAGEVVYGTTTGFGSLVSKVIPEEDTELLQRNIILTHSTSMGEPLDEEGVRAIMLIALKSHGIGVSGVRPKVVELYRDMLNKGVTPFVPCHGSVGYLTLEAHVASVAIGEGRAYYDGELMPAADALKRAGLEPIVLSYKEGLALINGNISVAALSGLAMYDLLNALKAADIIAAISTEALNGLTTAYDERIMEIRGQHEQRITAENLLALLKGSDVTEKSIGTHVQDALSLRCIPQAHGGVKKIVTDAAETIRRELDSTGDNPVFLQDGTALSSGNPDGAFEGLAMDSCCIAATYLAKMSERRNNRFIDENLSGLPAYLVKEPGLNSGLMIPHYSQAGILNEMRMLSIPACVDNVPTSANQEDYVSMAFNACQKTRKCVGLLEYVLAVELFSGFNAQQFIDAGLKRGKGTGAVLDFLSGRLPVMEKDYYLHPRLELTKDLIHDGSLVEVAEKAVGELAL